MSTTIFDGVFTPSITPITRNGSIDYENWGKHLDHLAQAGMGGVLLWGSIGEFYAFSLSEKEEAVKFAIDRLSGKMKVFAGVGGTNLAEVVDFAQYAQTVGADAVVAVSPYYYAPSLAKEEEYFAAIAEATQLPIIIYNFPETTGVSLPVEFIVHMAQRFGNILGLKDTIDSMSHTRQVIEAVHDIKPEFAVFNGYDEYYALNRMFGGAGVIGGLSNIEPEVFVAADRAWKHHEYSSFIAAVQRIKELTFVTSQADDFISAVKYAVSVRGLPISEAIRRPEIHLTDLQKRTIRAIVSPRQNRKEATSSNSSSSSKTYPEQL